MNEPPPVSVIQVRDPDILMAAIRDAHLEPCQLSSGPALSRLARLTCPNVCLDFAALGPSMHFAGEMARTCYTLVFVVACPDKGCSFNFSVEHHDGYLGFFPPGGALDAMTPEGYSNVTLTVPTATFHATLAQHFPGMPEDVLTRGAGMRVGAPEQIRLRRLLAAVENTIWNSADAFAAAPVRQQIEGELLAAFIAALRSGCRDLVPPPAPGLAKRLRNIRKARDFIDAHLHQPLYLHELGTALDLTQRSVENLFRDFLGVSPTSYVRHQRLHGVRRALLHAAPAPGAVKHAALDWGFWHHGHFARDYRTLFGEGPAVTLARH